ncbi:uncharacterized protein LAESUDRAFT_693990 [Laetiporus sulphureus 93-53]|uniref:Uncharacterized protein n=1 Tax=Laetiporus sulphureus 93-53 TaxID=1314785 RepID=A0A165GI97_9APHY|nr:uncharacterized protein LAESUDRAFT_693990 [Laetiporus sulphureus 93-53]KZT10386.1 hypothetical protein LAESUDRAFT_693990 [Laetiporus sulphureus 93-53]
MDARGVKLTPQTQRKCRLAEIVQYKCDVEMGHQGQPQFHCWPVPRIFRICPGRPAVEMTRFVKVDMSTGEISVPPESSQTLPEGKPWRDVKCYDDKLEELL